jgi:hypothetical protein
VKKARIKSWAGFALVIISIGGGWILISGGSDRPDIKPKAAPLTANLKVELRPTGPEGLMIVRTIQCPKDKEFCRDLMKLRPADFALPAGQVCSAQYGGPSVADVSGTLKGVKINTRLSVNNGCQINQWNQLAEALGIPRSASGPK